MFTWIGDVTFNDTYATKIYKVNCPTGEDEQITRKCSWTGTWDVANYSMCEVFVKIYVFFIKIYVFVTKNYALLNVVSRLCNLYHDYATYYGT